MWRFAKAVSASGLAPKGIETPEAILVALQMGAELGLTPMASLQNIAVINGRPSVWGDAMLGICRGSGCFDEGAFSEGFEGQPGTDAWTAVCQVRRAPDGALVSRRFSVARAKKAGLWGKTGPWQTYPDRMLQMRARSWALRDTFSDILRGFLTTEEVRDIPPRGQAIGEKGAQAVLERLSLQQEPEPEYNPPTAEEIATAETQVDPAVEAAQGVDEPALEDGPAAAEQLREVVQAYFDRIARGTTMALVQIKADADEDDELTGSERNAIDEAVAAREKVLRSRARSPRSKTA
jgi:hypothetical protein